LWGVEMITDANWFLRLGLPLTLITTLYAFALAWLCLRRNKRDLFVKVAIALTASGVLVVLIEHIINRYIGGSLWPRWSVYALFPCLVLSVIVLMLNKRAKFKSELKRRFYI